MAAKPTLSPLQTTDLLTVTQLSRDEIEMLLATAGALKADRTLYAGALDGMAMVMLFEKPSLRTRMTFEIGFARLGGHPVYVDQQSARIGQRESVSDCAKNLERWADVIVARTFSHETIEELAANASVPVINALSDRFHPCQALADVQTITEQFPDRTWRDLTVAYIGDGNNVCHSLMLTSALLGLNMSVITPVGYEPVEDVVSRARSIAASSGSNLQISHNLDAAADHDVIYADTWTSMGAEGEAEQRMNAFNPYQVTQQVMNAAGPEAIFMHCLPAYRGKEVAAEVIDGPRSLVFDEAENRMHAQNALLLHLLAPTSADSPTHATTARQSAGAASPMQ